MKVRIAALLALTLIIVSVVSSCASKGQDGTTTTLDPVAVNAAVEALKIGAEVYNQQHPAPPAVIVPVQPAPAAIVRATK